MAIYVNFEIPKTIGEFLIKFFGYKNFTHDYLFYKSVTTYKDKECTEVECNLNKYRSFDALLEIINTYYPNTSPKQLMHELLTINNQPNCENYSSGILFCDDIDNITIYIITQNRNDYYSRFDKSSAVAKQLDKKINNKYTWRELLNMLGINSGEEIIKYIEKHTVKQLKLQENEGVVN